MKVKKIVKPVKLGRPKKEVKATLKEVTTKKDKIGKYVFIETSNKRAIGKLASSSREKIVLKNMSFIMGGSIGSLDNIILVGPTKEMVISKIIPNGEFYDIKMIIYMSTSAAKLFIEFQKAASNK